MSVKPEVGFWPQLCSALGCPSFCKMGAATPRQGFAMAAGQGLDYSRQDKGEVFTRATALLPEARSSSRGVCPPPPGA